MEILETNMRSYKTKVRANGRSTVLMIRKVLVDYIRDIASIRKEHLEQRHNLSFKVSPCTKAKRTIGMTDYTKAFLAAADKAANLSKDDKEGPGLAIIPEEFTEEDLKVMTKVI